MHNETCDYENLSGISILVKGFALRKNLAKETAKFCQSMVRNELDCQEYSYVKQKESEPAKRKGRSESKLIRKRQKGSESTAKTKQFKPVILKRNQTDEHVKVQTLRITRPKLF